MTRLLSLDGICVSITDRLRFDRGSSFAWLPADHVVLCQPPLATHLIRSLPMPSPIIKDLAIALLTRQGARANERTISSLPQLFTAASRSQRAGLQLSE